MKIVAPIVNVGEIEVLANAGANEFYCGFVPDDWGTRFRAANLNQRASDNFCSYAELAQAVRMAHQCDCSLALVLNAQSYTDEQGDALVSIANSFLDMGGDALIVSDLALIAELYEHVPLRRIHISSVATCRTHSAAWFCKELGASRLILPRDVTIDEACEIASEVPGLEVETLILNDAWMPRRLGGLCALPALLSGGIAAVKIAGRAAPTARKQASVRMVRAVLDQIEAGERSKQVMRFAQALRPSVEHCRTGYMCNYPEVPKQ